MEARFRSWWQKIRRLRIAISVSLVIVVVVIALFIVGYQFDVTGFNGYTQISTIRTLSGPTAGTVTRTEAYQPGKTLWDWMQLLIIPFALALIALWFNRTERKNERTLSSDNQQEAALQSYLDRMSELLLEKKLRESDPNAEVRTVARVRTLSMLYQLNTRRINYMLAFLRESGLIANDPDTSIVSLRKADLRQVDLRDVDLHGLDLSETSFWEANLSGASFFKANLTGTNFRKSNLSKADLSFANLSGTVFSETNLSGATITGANFNNTFFGGANLSGANFSLAKFMEDELRAKLGKVDLSKTYLKHATIDKTSLGEIFVTKQQIETMNITDS
jgi:uncharacterized protein YjbI with pentapeptide repeats